MNEISISVGKVFLDISRCSNWFGYFPTRPSWSTYYRTHKKDHKIIILIISSVPFVCSPTIQCPPATLHVTGKK